MGTPLGPKYIPYTYMDPLGIITLFATIWLIFYECCIHTSDFFPGG